MQYGVKYEGEVVEWFDDLSTAEAVCKEFGDNHNKAEVVTSEDSES